MPGFASRAGIQVDFQTRRGLPPVFRSGARRRSENKTHVQHRLLNITHRQQGGQTSMPRPSEEMEFVILGQVIKSAIDGLPGLNARGLGDRRVVIKEPAFASTDDGATISQ